MLFFSSQIGDMSLADCATMCLSVVMTQLASLGCPKVEYREIVQCTILDAVRKGLKSKTEVRTPKQILTLSYVEHLQFLATVEYQQEKWQISLFC